MREVSIIGRLITKAHELVSERIQKGDTVLDATLGNGHDALFLAQCVGEEGILIGFDVQQEAIDATRARLLDDGFPESMFELHCLSHEQMIKVDTRPVRAIMFNLGYLPGADKSLITQTETTLSALDQALSLLTPDGILSVMCYPGHEGGDSEAARVLEWFIEKEEAQGAQVSHITRASASKASPFLLTLCK